MEDAILGIGNFTKLLYNTLSQKGDNLFFSPVSLHSVLANASQGAQGTTKEAFAKALRFSNSSGAADSYEQVLWDAKNITDSQFSMANKIYVLKNVSLNPTFQETTQKKFWSEVEAADFASAEDAATSINSWVEEKTDSKIKDYVSLSKLGGLVLVNAVYFNSEWTYKFDPAETKTGKFFLNEKQSIDVQMMSNTDRYLYNENFDSKFLGMPFANPDVSLVIILPNQRSGLGELEQKLQGVNITNIFDEMTQVEVSVKVPKFRIETTLDLEGPLREMGLGDIFDEAKADFSEISSEKLFVNKIIHKTFIEVIEDGTEPAAESDGFFFKNTPPSKRQPKIVTADHPFILAVVYEKNKILFYGVVTTPSYKAS